MRSTKSKSKTIDEYLAGASAEQRVVLEKLRRAIHNAAPGAEEYIGYGLAGFKFNGRPLVYFGAWKNHCALYAASPAVQKKFEKALKGFAVSKATIRFAPDKPLPIALVKKVVKARIAENNSGFVECQKLPERVNKPRSKQSFEGSRTAVTVTLSVPGRAREMDFYKAALGANELYRLPGGGVSQLAVSGAEFWVAEESPPHKNFSAESLKGCSVRMLLIVKDPAAAFGRAIQAGAKDVEPVTDAHCWRLGRIVDPFGHHWEIRRPLS